jgi:hypothetical protein
MDEKDILNNPSPTNDLTAAPVASKADHEEPQSWLGPLAKYKEDILNAFRSLRPVKAVELVDTAVEDIAPGDPQPNTAHAIIEAARNAAIDAAKEAILTKQSYAIGSNSDPNRISMSSNNQVENNFADKDPQTYQQMLPNAKINPQISQKGQAMPNNMNKLAFQDAYSAVGYPEEANPNFNAIVTAGGLGVGAGLMQHQLSRRAAANQLSQLAGDYIHMAESGGFNRNKLRLLNQELAERGLTNRLIEAGSSGIAKARMDKIVGELSSNLLKSKLKAAAPFAILGASVPFIHDSVEDYL